MKTSMSVLLAVSAAASLSACSLLPPADSTPDATTTSSSSEAPSTTAAPVRQLTEFELRGVTFGRDDFSLDWVSVPFEDDGENVAVEADYAACLELDPSAAVPQLSVESDMYVLADTGLAAFSGVVQYSSVDVATTEFEVADTAAGRECFRRYLRADAPSTQEIFVTNCEPPEDLRVDARCVLVESVQLDEATGESYAFAVEFHNFRSGSVIATAALALRGGSLGDVPAEVVEPFWYAVYALSDRLAVLDVD